MNTIDATPLLFRSGRATLARSRYSFVNVLLRTNTQKAAVQRAFPGTSTGTIAIVAMKIASRAGRDGSFAGHRMAGCHRDGRR
jgi:hypothetical protein